MFTDKLAFPKELLPCEIGDTVYTIEKHIQSWNPIKTYQYVIEDAKCEGFIIDYYDNKMEIRPAYNTWDGWVPICDDVCVDDDGYGYYTDIEEVKNKVKELNEAESFRVENRWIEEL